MIRSELREILSYWLDDLKQAYFTAVQLNTWLNLAQRQVQMKLLQAGQNWYMKPVETLTVANQADYVLPSDFMQLHRVEIVISGTGVNEARQPVTPITTNQQDLVTIRPGIPAFYYIKKDRITLSPIPSQQWVMRLYYSPRAVDMTQDTDSPDVPEQFMEYVALLACQDGFVKDDRTMENLQQKRAPFEKLLEEMANDRTMDQPRQVVQTGGGDYGGFW